MFLLMMSVDFDKGGFLYGKQRDLDGNYAWA